MCIRDRSLTDKKFMNVNPFPWIIYSCETDEMNCFILKRDINNITNFFVKRGLTVENPVDVIARITK